MEREWAYDTRVSCVARFEVGIAFGEMDERKAVEVEVEWHGQGSQTVEPAESISALVLCSRPIQNLSQYSPRRSFLDSWGRAGRGSTNVVGITSATSAPPGYN